MDVDNTIGRPNDPDFYLKYGQAVNRAVSALLGIPLQDAIQVADYYRSNFGGGETALFSGTIGKFFPEYGEIPPDFGLLYDEICKIDESGQFNYDGVAPALLRSLRLNRKKIAVITDSPEDLSRRILADMGIDPDQDFDLYLPYKREVGPLKILLREQIFSKVAMFFNIPPERSLSVGDSYSLDIQPAEQLGMKVCLVSFQKKEGYTGLQVETFPQMFKVISKTNE